jgi:hypothetical protein
MSRGHGKWERAILEALERRATFYLTELLPTPHTRSQVSALNRAARKLANASKIETRRYSCRAEGKGFIMVIRPGDPNQPLSVAQIPGNLCDFAAICKCRTDTVGGQHYATLRKPLTFEAP